jgi:hypothetical protein
MGKKLSTKKNSESTEKSPWVSNVHKSIQTPPAELVFCYVAKPHYYAGSHVPRYSVTLRFDPSKKAHAMFIHSLEKLATEHGVAQLGTMIKGFCSIKFQGRECPAVFSQTPTQKTPMPFKLEHDLEAGIEAVVEFELNSYVDKRSQRNGFNFSPKKVIFTLPDQKKETPNETDSDSSDRPGTKNNRVRNSKLRSTKKRSVGKQRRDDKDAG